MDQGGLNSNFTEQMVIDFFASFLTAFHETDYFIIFKLNNKDFFGFEGCSKVQKMII